MQITFYSRVMGFWFLVEDIGTGKSLSEALIFASIHPQYDNRLFMELPVQLSYCGLVDARISASEKDLPVQEFVLLKPKNSDLNLKFSSFSMAYNYSKAY